MNNRLIIQELAGILAEHTGKDKNSAELFLREFVTVVSEGVFADKIAKVKGLGTFKIIPVEKRESIHVNTGERFLIPEHYKFSFLPDKELRELVNKPFSFFETTELGDTIEFSDVDVSEEPEDKEGEDESVEEVMPDKELPIVNEPVLPVEQMAEILPEEIPITEQEKVIEDSLQEEILEEQAVSEEITEQVAEISEEQVTPTFELDPVKKSPEPESKELPRRTFPMRVALIGIGLIAVIGVVLYLNRGLFITAEAPVTPEIPTSLPDNKSAFSPPTSSLPIDSVQIVPVEHIQQPEILAKVKIEPGSRLTLIALEYYGSKLFWVYLYEYNKAKIKDPNNIPVGTEIEIPAPEKYGIDAHDRASKEKAAARQTEILSGKL